MYVRTCTCIYVQGGFLKEGRRRGPLIWTKIINFITADSSPSLPSKKFGNSNIVKYRQSAPTRVTAHPPGIFASETFGPSVCAKRGGNHSPLPCVHPPLIDFVVLKYVRAENAPRSRY